jgi:hypothetical protein
MMLGIAVRRRHNGGCGIGGDNVDQAHLLYFRGVRSESIKELLRRRHAFAFRVGAERLGQLECVRVCAWYTMCVRVYNPIVFKHR